MKSEFIRSRRTDFGFEVGVRKIRKSEILVQLD